MRSNLKEVVEMIDLPVMIRLWGRARQKRRGSRRVRGHRAIPLWPSVRNIAGQDTGHPDHGAIVVCELDRWRPLIPKEIPDSGLRQQCLWITVILAHLQNRKRTCSDEPGLAMRRGSQHAMMTYQRAHSRLW